MPLRNFVFVSFHAQLDYSVVEAKVNKWSSQLKSAKRQQATETAFKKRSERVEPVDILKVDKGEAVRDAIAILDNVQGGATPSILDFCKVRSYLQYAILTQNACRAGLICNFDKAVFDSRVFHQESQKTVFSFARHKTSTSLGTADISVDDLTFRHLDIFVEKLRSHVLSLSGIADGPDVPIFSTTDGKWQKQSNIATSLTKMFQSVGFEHRVTCTALIYTAATTSFNNATLDNWQRVINHMKHSGGINKKYYVAHNAVKLACIARDLIGNLMRGGQPEKEAENELMGALRQLTAAVIGRTTDIIPQDELFDTLSQHFNSDTFPLVQVIMYVFRRPSKILEYHPEGGLWRNSVVFSG